MNKIREKIINERVSPIGNGAHIIVPKGFIGCYAKVTIFPKCFYCKYYKKRGEICNTDACTNKKYISEEVGERSVSYLAFASNLPELPKDCKYFEKGGEIMEDFCKNLIHKKNIYTYKVYSKKDYRLRSSLDSDLCVECLQKVLDWKHEKPVKIGDKDFNKKGLIMGADMTKKIKNFVLNRKEST